MAHPDPAKIRNVAVLGHRGSGKTSLVEAMLHAAGETNRLGSVADGTTVSDFDDDERRRSMSITASLCHLTWQGVKVNLIDTPGEPSFQGDCLAALRAVDSALIVVNATAGVEVQTERLWSRAGEQGVAARPGDHDARPRARRLRRDHGGRQGAGARGRGDPDPDRPGGRSPGGHQPGLDDRHHLRAGLDRRRRPARSPTTWPRAPSAAREALIDVVAENDDALIEKYLEGEEITTEELIGGILAGVAEGRIFPVVCAGGASGAGVDRALDLLIEALPSPADVGSWTALDPESGEPVTVTLSENGSADGLLLQDRGRPVQRPHQPAARLLGRPAQRQPRHLRAQRLQGAAGPALHAPGQGARAAPGDRARGTSARWPS